MTNEEENENHSDLEESPDPVFRMNPYMDYIRFIEEGNGSDNTGTMVFHPPTTHSGEGITGEFGQDGILSSSEQEVVLKKQMDEDVAQEEGTDEEEEEEERIEG